jgi:uncharacterized protein (DUF1778 family)
MTASTTQISANISRETKKLLDAYVRKRGVKKSYVIEQALRHHLLAVNEIPEEYIIPPVLRVTDESARMIADMMEQPPDPTSEMRELMARK